MSSYHQMANRSVKTDSVGDKVTAHQSVEHNNNQHQQHQNQQPRQQSPQLHSRSTAEEEVDRLTDILVQSLENASDLDFFGICSKCRGRVLGEGNGCTAMGQIYHIRCFTCRICREYKSCLPFHRYLILFYRSSTDKELRGLPSYNVDGKPLCEEDYLNTLEKCCVCCQPIRDRILRATGRPYHPTCFSCIACGKCLEGIPFTVDNLNRVHCIEDFHRKFAPRCCVCSEPILPEPGQQETVRIVALDKSYHVNCYRCEDCGIQLNSEHSEGRCYPLDDHILCRVCNASRINRLTAA